MPALLYHILALDIRLCLALTVPKLVSAAVFFFFFFISFNKTHLQVGE